MFSSIVGKGGMEQLFENKELNMSVRTVRRGGEVLFYAKDVAESLGYKKPRNAIQNHVWEEDKRTLSGLQGGPAAGPPCSGQPNTIFITEQGVYQLIFKSELKHAKEFRRWVFRDILPSIRKTGSYKLPTKPQKLESLYDKQLKLINETDLHYAVVRYIRRFHPDALIIAGLGEYQDTTSRRCDAFHKGYKGGQPDLIITNTMNGYSGLAIELKTPKGNGVIRENQTTWLNLLNKQQYKTLISNDYTDIILQIDKYFRVDLTVKYKKEIEKLKRECSKLKKLCESEVAWYKPRLSNYKY